MPNLPPDAGPSVPFSASDVDQEAYAGLRGACLRLSFLPTFCHGVLLDVAMPNPDNEAALAEIRQLTHQEVRRFRISEVDFDRTVSRLEAALPPKPPHHPESPLLPRPQAWDFGGKTARQIATEIVAFAFAAGASDILLDEQEEWLEVSIKVAGEKEILPPVERTHAALLMKAFKELSGISTFTSMTWQSGFARIPVGESRRADLRVEVTPTVQGESLVARLQDRDLQLERMRLLPFRSPDQIATARACLRQHQGLIIATGPTGHGKTTTLYACLGQLDRSRLNIRTLEDPVEFTVPWITQIPVGGDTGRSFGDGLKSLLRQAPHVILMGEIRDSGVAQTCVEAVDTGHLILATLHTRNALGAVSRLLDLGLSGRQIATSLTLVIGQRLLRRLCPHCRRPVSPSDREIRHFERYHLPRPGHLHVPGGCARCGERGERGVVPVFEFFHAGGDDRYAEAIANLGANSVSEGALQALWLELGGKPLVREGLELAAEGLVSHAEVLKYEPRPPPC